MEKTKLSERLFTFDAESQRIDIAPTLTILLSFVAVLTWAILVPSDGLWARLLSGLVFIGIVQVILGMLRASKISMFIVSLLALILFGSYTPGQLAVLSSFLAIVALAQAYFLYKNKIVGALGAIAAGLIAAGLGPATILAVLLFCLLLVSRVIWHYSRLEHLPRKIWLLFGVKAFLMALFVVLFAALTESKFTFPWANNYPLSWPHVYWPTLVVLVAVILRGLWGVMLLRTRRSPTHRGIMLFYLAVAGVVAALIFVLRTYGPDVLLPSVMESLRTVGVTAYTPEVLTIALLTGLSLLSVGIDRSLYRPRDPFAQQKILN